MGLETSEGRVEAAPETGQVAETSESSGEQSVTSNQTTGKGSEAEAIESFFDPKDVIGTPNEAGYKQMQAAFTKGMQGVKDQQTKIDAYDAFQRDPRGTIEQMAKQYGYNFVQSDPNQSGDDSWQPKTWDDVMERATEIARKELRQEFEPLTSEVQDLKRRNVESYLDAEHPDWRTYEGRMVDTLKAHPSMASDPDKLYQLSVPPELLEQRATKAAIAKLKGESVSSEVSGNKTTSVSTTTEPTGPISLQDAVKVAKSRLAAQGIARPVGE